MLLPVHMTHFLPKAFHVLLLFLAFIAKAQNCKTTCGSGRSVPHPFGFSDWCTIRLNCSESTSEILISNFTVQNITSTSIFVNLPAKCNRRVESMLPLFGPNFGPTWNNSLLYQSCPNLQNDCYIPAAFVQRQFALDSCKANNDSISCFALENNKGSEIMDYNTLVQTKCKYLFGSIAVSSAMDSTLSLEFETIELGWWVSRSACDCADKATCTHVKLGEEKPPGFRCQCWEGFHGDGYREGSACQPGAGGITSSGEGDDKEQDDDPLINLGISVSILLGFITGFWTVCGSLVLHDSWRNSYFTFLNAIKDWIVKTAMYIAKMQRS